MFYDSWSKFHNIQTNQFTNKRKEMESQRVTDSNHIPDPQSRPNPACCSHCSNKEIMVTIISKKRSVWLTSLFNTQPQCCNKHARCNQNEHILGLQQLRCWSIIIIVNVIRLCQITKSMKWSAQMLQVKCSPTNMMCPHQRGYVRPNEGQ